MRWRMPPSNVSPATSKPTATFRRLKSWRRCCPPTQSPEPGNQRLSARCRRLNRPFPMGREGRALRSQVLRGADDSRSATLGERGGDQRVGRFDRVDLVEEGVVGLSTYSIPTLGQWVGRTDIVCPGPRGAPAQVQDAVADHGPELAQRRVLVSSSGNGRIDEVPAVRQDIGPLRRHDRGRASDLFVARHELHHLKCAGGFGRSGGISRMFGLGTVPALSAPRLTGRGRGRPCGKPLASGARERRSRPVRRRATPGREGCAPRSVRGCRVGSPLR